MMTLWPKRENVNIIDVENNPEKMTKKEQTDDTK